MFKDLPEGQTHYLNDGCGEPAHNDDHQHPERDWEKEFKATKFGKGGGACFECCDYESMYSDLQSFIARHIEAAYNQGFKEGSFQSKRLLENNKMLQEKIRAAKREVLESILIKITADCIANKGNYDPFRLSEYVETLLSYQQEPKDV